MNYLSKKLTAYILRKGLISQENTDAYEYGFLYLLEVLVSLFCSIIIAVFLNAEVECLLFFLFFIPLRSYSGGFHTNHYISCLILSCCLLFSGYPAMMQTWRSIKKHSRNRKCSMQRYKRLWGMMKFSW